MFLMTGLLCNRLLIEGCFSLLILRDVFTEDLPEDFMEGGGQGGDPKGGRGRGGD